MSATGNDVREFKRRILIVTNRTGPFTSRGGMSAFISRLTVELATDHDVTVASHPSPDAAGSVIHRAGETFARAEPRDVAGLAELAQDHDIVLVNQWRHLVTAPERTVLMLHGGIDDSYPEALTSRTGRRRLRDDLTRPAALAACSNWAADTVAEFCRRDVTTLYPPVDPAFFATSHVPKRPVVGFAGRISTYKGADLVPVIASDPRLAGIEVEMTNLTPDTDVQQIVTDAAQAGIVRLVPSMHDTASMARYLAGLTMAVAPSRVEGFGLSAIEAQVSGTFVIATAVGGLPEAVLPGGGVLVPGTADEFAAAIVEHWGAVPDPEVRVMAAERFSAARTAQRLLALFN